MMHNDFNFVTIDDAIAWTREWVKTFSEDYDVIVGIPRSGLFIANIVALLLGKPLTTPDLFIEGTYWKSNAIPDVENITKVLLIDDSIMNGTTMRINVDMLHQACSDIHISTAVLIATENTTDLVDKFYKIVPHPRMFEWGLLHAKRGSTMIEMEGILCKRFDEDPSLEEHTCEYWARHASPLSIPTFEIDVIISHRGEKYFRHTEEWLKEHHVHYKELVLCGMNIGECTKQIIDISTRYAPDIIWVHDSEQAKEVFDKTKIPTLGFESMELYK